MSGEEVMFCYLGALGTILVLNAVQWSFSRKWVDGLFTLLVFISFVQSTFYRLFFDRFPLTQPSYLAIHTLVRGLTKIIFLTLLYTLFGGIHWQPRIKQWFSWTRLGVSLYMLADALLLVFSQEQWQYSLTSHLVSGVYWSLLAGLSLVGIWVAAKRADAVGRSFALGSLFMLMSETSLFFLATIHDWTLPINFISIDHQVQMLTVGRLVELLCFSLTLVFYQRQLAVKQAIQQTRLADELKQTQLEAQLALQQIEQEKTQVHLRALQAQVNPHFLFNSLNSLSSLIDEDPPRAGEFVNELSQVYRYLLRANEESLTTLASELDFIQAYYHLLKTRYGAGLNLIMAVREEAKSKLLPPLTLQLLVENAVKHNVTSAKRPLTIEILTEQLGRVTVRNNRQPKSTPVLSNGVGLAAIATQYQSLQQPGPVVLAEEHQFAVSLLLLAPSS